MVGRAERGLFITTGAFTHDAKVEATRDGAPLIDLVDGEELLDKLKELGLGVQTTTRTIEEVSVVPAFFQEVRLNQSALPVPRHRFSGATGQGQVRAHATDKTAMRSGIGRNPQA